MERQINQKEFIESAQHGILQVKVATMVNFPFMFTEEDKIFHRNGHKLPAVFCAGEKAEGHIGKAFLWCWADLGS
jgi:hypothetical protein